MSGHINDRWEIGGLLVVAFASNLLGLPWWVLVVAFLGAAAL